MKQKLEKFLPYIVAVITFTVVSLLYFPYVLKGETIYQSDIVQFKGMSKEISDFRKEKHEEPYWTNSAFAGMPAYNVSTIYPNDYVKKIDSVFRFLPRPADYLFLYFISFFILLLVLKVDWKLAILGSLAFGFSTYYVIILGVGHNAKAHAIAYMPMVLAGILMVLQRKKYFYGFLLTTLALALEINAGHPQMTYYLLFSVVLLGLFFLIKSIKTNGFISFSKEILLLVVGAVIAVSVNATSLLATKEYAKYSTRGKSELTITPDGKKKAPTEGLSKEYITEYSYGFLETFNLFIPRFMGGGSREDVGTESNTYRLLKKNVNSIQAKQFSENTPTYWGNQPIVEAPAYIGAIVLFLFVLGLFLVEGTLRKWLVATVIVGLVFSWGKNIPIVTNFLIDYFPLYNKFRAVSSAQVIVELAVPLLGILGLQSFFSSEITKEEKRLALKKSFLITGGLALIFTILGTSLFSFESPRDTYYADTLNGQLVGAIISDRKAMFFSDSLRTLMLIIATAGAMFFYVKNKWSKKVSIAVIAILILFDLGQVAKRYVNQEDFVASSVMDRPFTPSKIDKAILQDTTYYRVANFAGSPMNEAKTSYFHHSIGGYHAAKMKRYQELFDYQIAKNNMQVLNMLNVKYVILGEDRVQLNTEANGNAWFVDDIAVVKTADDEMKELEQINTKKTAVVREPISTKSFSVKVEPDSLATIQLKKYDTNHLVYESNAKGQQFAVFSEIYYKDGWNAYIDGKLTPHYQTDYVLRGMEIPAGKHQIEFKFEPYVIELGKNISLGAYILFVAIILVSFFVRRKK